MTIPLDPRFIPAFSIETVLLDKDTGAPLSGGLVYFEEDAQRGVMKPVYQITGTSPNYTFTQLPNPMTLSSIGTFEDSLSNPVVPYFYPYDSDGDVELYYVRVTNSDDVDQFDREAVPYISSSGSSDVASAFVNELSNPQFAVVDFDTSTSIYTYNFTAASLETVQIAPDWQIEVSCPGAGTVTVSQITPVGTLNRPTNPGTILNISSAGLTHLRLRQRIYGSPNLWGSGYLSGGFTAKTYSGTDVTMTMYYSQSDGTVMDLAVLAATLDAGGTYTNFSGSVAIPASTSTQDFPDAYIDIEISIPLSIEVDITSIMVAGTGENSIDDIVYDQTTLARQIDQLFHYYQVPLNYKPIPSMLTAWDFPLNPAQFGSTGTITTTAAYAWDQTICKSVVGNIAVIRNTVTNGFQATTANDDEAFYQIQYLTGAQAKEILGNRLSVNVNAFRTQTGGACNVKVYLYSGRAASTVPILPTSLGTIDALGIFTLTAANWTLIPRGNLGLAHGTISAIDTSDYTTLNDVVDLDFNGWQLNDSAQIADTDKFAIVVTYSCPTTGTVVTTDSISLVPGDIPTRPAPQTFDQVLQECEFYYEKSYNNDVAIGSNTSVGQLVRKQTNNLTFNGGTGAVTGLTTSPSSFDIQWRTIKRTPGTVILYATDGTATTVRLSVYTAGSLTTESNIAVATYWTIINNGTKAINYITASNNSGFPTVSQGQLDVFIRFQYDNDARLGIIA